VGAPGSALDGALSAASAELPTREMANATAAHRNDKDLFNKDIEVTNPIARGRRSKTHPPHPEKDQRQA
jgi:hypothetical protein